jgi:hypothetical protein
MARLVRTLRVRRGAPCREKVCPSSATRTGTSRLVRTLRVRRGAPRLRASTLAHIRPTTFESPRTVVCLGEPAPAVSTDLFVNGRGSSPLKGDSAFVRFDGSRNEDASSGDLSTRVRTRLHGRRSRSALVVSLVGLGANVRGFDLLTRSASRSNAPTSPRRRSEGQRDGGSRLRRVSRPTFELPLLPTHRKCQRSGGRPAHSRGARVLTSALSLAADAALPPGEVWTILSMRAGGPGAWSARCACGAAPALRALR